MSRTQYKGIAISPEDELLVRRHKRRLLKDKIYKGLLVIALLLVLYPLGDMVYRFVYKGATLISLQTFLTTVSTSSSSFVSGGLANYIVGTLILVALAAIFAIPLGVLGGIYMAEFAENNRHSKIVRFLTDVLAGVPSIVLGYAGYVLLVQTAPSILGWGFSALAGGITLSVLMLPYILRTTELSINRVPTTIREAAIALGSSKTKMINRITFRLALPGIITGIIISLGIAFGETAPLLYTAGFGNYIPSSLIHEPVGYLTYVIFYFTQLPSQSAINLSYQASFLLICIVVSFNLVARVGLRRFSKI
ncbi:MAG: phosphate ABC transporter permease PstA [Thaumarchaeota archaeon]|nr:phosphate ABC transporter permease PstA [Nitrososphaerota archaeon]MDG6995415.1 phosphate ABC transporter permease PstA [Nitrososphaerota archaeon]